MLLIWYKSFLSLSFHLCVCVYGNRDQTGLKNKPEGIFVFFHFILFYFFLRRHLQINARANTYPYALMTFFAYYHQATCPRP